MNTPNLALPPQSLGHAPRPPIVAAEFRGPGDLKPPPCPGPATWALSSEHTALLFHGSPFLYIACYLTLFGLHFFCSSLSWPIGLFLWPSSLGSCSLCLPLSLLSRPGPFSHSYLLNCFTMPSTTFLAQIPTHKYESSLQPEVL